MVNNLFDHNECIQKAFLRTSLQWYNKRLDQLEEEIIGYGSSLENETAYEMVYHLINERENVKALLKEIHEKLYR